MNMFELVAYVIVSVLIVSAVSLVGIFTLFMKLQNLDKLLLYLVSFSVGALFGDVFIHLLPDVFGQGPQKSVFAGIYVLTGILFSFAIEKFIHWRHCHTPTSKKHVHPFAYVNLVGDAFHNFIDGLVIAGSYFVSIPAGIATTFAVILHEIPQEIGDFGVLVHGGFTKMKALLFNFITALTAVIGAIIGLFLGSSQSTFTFLVPFAAGNLLYIAGSDLIPELHKHENETSIVKESLLQLLCIILGICVMLALVFVE
jgi:zinc and cadmium transporter